AKGEGGNHTVTIVDASLSLMLSALSKHPTSPLSIWATGATIGSRTYQDKLLAEGVPAERIHAKIADPAEPIADRLAAAIESGDHAKMDALVRRYAEETVQELAPQREAFPGDPIVSLNCTHYGYVAEKIVAALAAIGVRPAQALNPNSDMLAPFLDSAKEAAVRGGTIAIKVISQTSQTDTPFGNVSANVAPMLRTFGFDAAANALIGYSLVPDLFPWRDIVMPDSVA
ncbi:MAG: hypothetical protein HY543_03075, partial [Deltaproteobacteria bacterium]|nr:hypothetical protein [Deltaproteobacteria bacterium]